MAATALSNRSFCSPRILKHALSDLPPVHRKRQDRPGDTPEISEEDAPA